MKKHVLSLAVLSALSACATTIPTGEPVQLAAAADTVVEVAPKAIRKAKAPAAVVDVPAPRVLESEDAFIPVVPRVVTEYDWLREQRVSVRVAKSPVPLADVLRSLASQGIGITSQLPLEQFEYRGVSLMDVDAETALRTVLGSVGLDFRVDKDKRLVSVEPMGARTWFVNPGPAVAGAGNDASEKFWADLRQELDARMKLSLPVAGSRELLDFESQVVGTYSVNGQTGAVTVRAPHWVQQELDEYFKRLQDIHTTDIVFQGELILLKADPERADGLQVASFARYAKDRYGLVFQPNGLGGVTLSVQKPGDRKADGLQVFQEYLKEVGKQVNTLQRPVLTTTSGVPADFRRTTTRYFNSVTQQVADQAVGTQNLLIAQDFGTQLRINPRIDAGTGLVRAQIELVQTMQSGTQALGQALTSAGKVEKVTSELPVVSKIVYSGEALLKDGDLVIMGGQTGDDSSDMFYFALRVSINKR